jgi:hypothetical protein
MPRIGIIGGGIAGTQVGLFLRRHGIAAAIYTDKTPDQHRAARISNVVARNGLTRARERALGIDDWDGQAPDLVRLNVTVNGPQPIRFSGALDPPSHVVDMRIVSSQDYTEAVTRLLTEGTGPGTTHVWDAISSLAMGSNTTG